MASRNAESPVDVTVILVNYNTRDLTLRAIDTLFDNAGCVSIELVVWDNASTDGSAEAISARFPKIELISSDANIGFGRANNEAAKRAVGEHILLLNPDTETHQGAVEALLAFARDHPRAGIVGGRTVFPDGTLNPTSCWNKMTIWSLVCASIGLSAAFPRTCLFNPEGIGCWQRDVVRKADIVTGCFLMIETGLWKELGGFDERFFMYGEDADLCLRAAELGYQPMVTPSAQIMHLVGASAANSESKRRQLLQGKATLINTHWSRATRSLGIALLLMGVAIRLGASTALSPFRKTSRDKAAIWRRIWRSRGEWSKGYE